MSPRRRVTKTTKKTHGGHRKGAGRKSPFPHKVRRPVGVALTKRSNAILVKLARKFRISKSNVVEALLVQCGEDGVLQLPKDRVEGIPPTEAV